MTPSSLRVGLLVLTAAAVVLAGSLFGLAPALIALAAGALLLGIVLLWSSVQSLTGDTPLSLEEALTMAAPSAEEEKKRSLLRALKDLQYERSVGKITPEDYQELFERYSTEAKQLMQDLDERLGPARERAEKLLRERLAKEAERAAASEREDTEDGPDSEEAEPSSAAASSEPESEEPEAPEPPAPAPVAATEPEVKS